MNRVWDADQISVLPVGQLPTLEADFVQDARWQLPEGFKSDHVCHEEWLNTGEPWPNDLPPTEYTAGQMPLCCMSPDDPTAGGLVIGGSAGDLHTATIPTSGGLVIGGSAGDVHYPPDPPAGGVEVGGEAGDAHTTSDPTAGGVEVGGEAGEEWASPGAPAGGVEVGGEAGDVHIVECVEEECCPTMSGGCTATVESCLGCWCPFFHTAEGSLWRRYPVTASADYNFAIWHHPASGGVWTLWSGDTCEDKVKIADGSESPFFLSFDFTALGDFVWLEISSPTTASNTGATILIAL